MGKCLWSSLLWLLGIKLQWTLAQSVCFSICFQLFGGSAPYDSSKFNFLQSYQVVSHGNSTRWLVLIVNLMQLRITWERVSVRDCLEKLPCGHVYLNYNNWCRKAHPIWVTPFLGRRSWAVLEGREWAKHDCNAVCLLLNHASND